MALADRLSWPGILNAADRTKSRPYVFEDDDDTDANQIIPIPISIDKRLETLRGLQGHLVTIEAEQHRLERELARINSEITRHTESIVKELAKSGLTTKVILEYLDQPPEIPEQPE